VLLPFTSQSDPHQLRGGLTDNDLAMDFGVVRMRVADEDCSVRLGVVRIKPEVQAGEIHSTPVKH
jgi:hypothetical protein